MKMNIFEAMVIIGVIFAFQSCNLNIKNDSIPNSGGTEINLNQIQNLQLKDENDSLLSCDFIVDNHEKLVFIYELINCNTCIESILNHLTIEYPFYKNRLIVISKYNNPRDLYVFKRVNHFNGLVYNDQNASIISKFQGKLPAFCIMKNGIISNIFYPDLNKIDLFEKYMSLVNDRLKNQ